MFGIFRVLSKFLQYFYSCLFFICCQYARQFINSLFMFRKNRFNKLFAFLGYLGICYTTVLFAGNTKKVIFMLQFIYNISDASAGKQDFTSDLLERLIAFMV